MYTLQFWIGLNDRVRSNFYVWLDETDVVSDFTRKQQVLAAGEFSVKFDVIRQDLNQKLEFFPEILACHCNSCHWLVDLLFWFHLYQVNNLLKLEPKEPKFCH